MNPAVYWILIGVSCLFSGAVIFSWVKSWATTNHDGVEPDSRPLGVRPPSNLELSVMIFADISYARWKTLSRAEQSRHIERYYKSIGL